MSKEYRFYRMEVKDKPQTVSNITRKDFFSLLSGNAPITKTIGVELNGSFIEGYFNSRGLLDIRISIGKIKPRSFRMEDETIDYFEHLIDMFLKGGTIDIKSIHKRIEENKKPLTFKKMFPYLAIIGFIAILFGMYLMYKQIEAWYVWGLIIGGFFIWIPGILYFKFFRK